MNTYYAKVTLQISVKETSLDEGSDFLELLKKGNVAVSDIILSLTDINGEIITENEDVTELFNGALED